MVRVILLCLLLTGCTYAENNRTKSILMHRAEKFCKCNSSKVQLFTMSDTLWGVTCENGTGTQNAGFDFDMECP